jgi:amino acid permease
LRLAEPTSKKSNRLCIVLRDLKWTKAKKWAIHQFMIIIIIIIVIIIFHYSIGFIGELIYGVMPEEILYIYIANGNCAYARRQCLY